MKKIFSRVMLVAATAMTFFGCQKPEAIAPESDSINGLTFTSEKPSFDDETKTEWTGTTIQWSKGDKIRVAYTCDGVWQNADGTATADEADGEKTAKLYASTGLDAAKDVATFEVPGSFVSQVAGIYQFYGIYPSSLTSGTAIKFAPSVTIEIPAEQIPTANSFAASADVMVAQSDIYDGMPKNGDANGSISLKWNRLVAHGYITLKGLQVDGQEKVQTIVLTANTEADMVGKHYVNLDTQVVTKADESATNVITIDGTNLTIDNDGNVSFWISFLPCTWTSLNVSVDTDKATYTREIDLAANQKTFAKNARNILAIGMATAERVAKEIPVADYSGTYVIVAKRNSENKFYYMTGVDCGASTKRFVAELAGETCPTDVEDLDDTYKWEVSKSGDAYVVTCVDNGQSIFWTSGNSAYLAETGRPFVVAENEDGTFTFKYAASDGDRYISLNGATNNNYFALYKSGQSMNLHLLPVTPDTTPRIILGQSTLDLSAEASTGTINVTPKYVSDVRVTALAAKDAQEESDWLTVEYADGVITYTASANESSERTAYIEVYATGNDASEVIEGIVVTQDAYVAPDQIVKATIEEFLAATPGVTKYQLTGVIQSIANTTYGNLTINDGTASVFVYGLTKTEQETNDKSFASIGLRVGDTVTLVGVRADYNSTPQVGSSSTVPAYYISHIVAPYFELTEYTGNVANDATTHTVNFDSNLSWTATASSGVTLNPTSGEGMGSVVMTFAANETDAAKIHTVTFTAGEITATYTLTQAAKPAEGADPAWTLVTDASTLAAGDQIVIVAKNAKYAMSTTQNSNNRAQAAVTKDGNIITFGSDVQILTLKAGKTTGTYSFYTGSGYLYAASSSKNYLRTETTLSANSSWKIEITSAGVATIKAQGSNTRNWLRYNSSNNPPIFACYASGQTDVCIYKLQ